MAEKKTRPKRGLGKGMSALFGEEILKSGADPGRKESGEKNEEAKTGGTPSDQSGEVMISINDLRTNGSQPRKNFDEEALAELTESVRQYGILQPLIVQKEDTFYRIIAGERRYRAAKEAGLTEVPVIVRDYTDQLAAEISIIENVQRADLNPMEEAMAYQMLSTDYGLKQEEIASRVSKNRATIANSMRLLKLSTAVQEMIASGSLSAGHGRTLIGVEDEDEQLRLAREMSEKGLSVREAEKLIKTAEKSRKQNESRDSDKKTEEKRQKEQTSLLFQEYEENMRQILGTKVRIQRRDKNKGKIEIEYYSNTELERLLELFHTLKND